MKKKTSRTKRKTTPRPRQGAVVKPLFEKLNDHSKWIVLSFFVLYLLLGLLVYDDYGLSWDDNIQRNHGLVSMDYVNEKWGNPFYEEKIFPDKDLRTYDLGFYGVLFSMSAFGVEQLLGVNDFRSSFLIRHLMTFLLFWLGAVFFYKLCKLRFTDWKLALLATAFLVISPRIFAHSFFNVKDLVLLSCYIISTYTMVRFLRHPTLNSALVHALACGVVINTRILGILIPLMTLVFWVLVVLHQKEIKNYVAQSSLYLGVFAFFTFCATILFWPYLWEAPVANFLDAFGRLGQYQWNSDMLFMGSVIRPSSLPWYYIPVWIGVTTPILYLLLMLAGLFFIFRRIISSLQKKRLYRSPDQFIDLVWLATGLGPLFIVIVMGSNLYNGWRHMYFIYPSLMGIAAVGLVGVIRLLEKRINASSFLWSRYAIVGIIVLSLATTAYQMVKDHPWQQIYFNALAGGGDLMQQYDQDYWGLSFKAAYEELLRRDKRERIKVNCMEMNIPCKQTIQYLPAADQQRLEYVPDINQADYYMTNYLWSDMANYLSRKPPVNQEFFSLQKGATKIVGAYIVK